MAHTLTTGLSEASCTCGWYTVLVTVAEREALTECPMAAQQRSEDYTQVTGSPAPARPARKTEEKARTDEAVVLEVEGSRGATYEVRLYADGRASCSCPSWRFQHLPPAERTCKHTRAAAAQRHAA